MTLGFERARFYLATLVDEYGLATLLERLQRKTNEQPLHVPRRDEISLDAVESRWALLGVDEETKSQLLDDWSIANLENYLRHTEHLR